MMASCSSLLLSPDPGMTLSLAMSLPTSSLLAVTHGADSLDTHSFSSISLAWSPPRKHRVLDAERKILYRHKEESTA